MGRKTKKEEEKVIRRIFSVDPLLFAHAKGFIKDSKDYKSMSDCISKHLIKVTKYKGK